MDIKEARDIIVKKLDDDSKTLLEDIYSITLKLIDCRSQTEKNMIEIKKKELTKKRDAYTQAIKVLKELEFKNESPSTNSDVVDEIIEFGRTGCWE